MDNDKAKLAAEEIAEYVQAFTMKDGYNYKDLEKMTAIIRKHVEGEAAPAPLPPMSDEPNEPFFKTEREYQDALDLICTEWRLRDKSEACTDFDEWKIREIMKLRAEIEKVWAGREK